MMEASDQSLEAIDVLNQVETRLMEISEHAITGGFSGIPDIVKNSFGSIDKLYEQGREVTGLRTHFVEFDKMTSGLQDSELIIIAARPSMGKTAWAINIAQNSAVRDGNVVAVFSLEMSKESLLRRMLAGEASVGARKLQTGFLGRDDKDKLNAGLERLMESKLFVDDTPGITLAEMRAKARRLKQQEGRLDLIVIDYLQLMTGSAGASQKKFENRTQEVSSVSRGLKALAKELRVPVVALSQLSRGSEQRTGDKKPLLSDLRESGLHRAGRRRRLLHPPRGVLRPRKRRPQRQSRDHHRQAAQRPHRLRQPRLHRRLHPLRKPRHHPPQRLLSHFRLAPQKITSPERSGRTCICLCLRFRTLLSFFWLSFRSEAEESAVAVFCCRCSCRKAGCSCRCRCCCCCCCSLLVIPQRSGGIRFCPKPSKLPAASPRCRP